MKTIKEMHKLLRNDIFITIYGFRVSNELGYIFQSKGPSFAQTCDGGAEAFLTYSTRSFPNQVLHVTEAKINDKRDLEDQKIMQNLTFNKNLLELVPGYEFLCRRLSKRAQKPERNQTTALTCGIQHWCHGCRRDS